METHAVAELLGVGGDSPVLAPIADHLKALATERRLPGLAIGTCLLRMEEAGPPLRAVLVRAADGEALSEDEATLLFRGLYILGGARDRAAFQPLLRLLRRPADEVEHLLGDGVTEGLARIVVGVFDGDVEALFAAITDRTIDEYVRHALLGAATFLTWDGRIEHQRMRQLLEDFPEDCAPEPGDCAWIGWLYAIALLGLRDLAPLVFRVWDADLLPERVLDRHHFEADLAAAERAPGDAERFTGERLGYIDDVVAALQWTDRPADDDEYGGLGAYEQLMYPTAPVINPLRGLGRNDPCPCFSGKKYKKCCLAAG